MLRAFHRNHIASNWLTYSGMQDQYKQDDVKQRTVKRIISHPDYNQMTNDYDIALLELSEPLEFTNTIQPICLPASSHMFPAGMSCWVTGWGAMREGGIIILEESGCFSNFLAVTEYFTIFECLDNGRPAPPLFFPLAHPALITIKTTRCSPILLTISYSSPSFIFFPAASCLQLSHFILSPSFPLMSVPFLYLTHHDILLSCASLPPFSSHLFLICSIPLSLLLYPYIKTDTGSPGKPLKPSLANTNPAH